MFCVILSVIFNSLIFTSSAQSQSIFETEFVKTLSNSSKTNSAKIRLDDENETPHTLVGGYYTTRNGLKSNLLLNNKGPQPLEVLPILYGTNGETLQIPPITVPRNSHQTINLGDWANIGGEGFREGNIKLFHRGKDIVLGTQIQIIDENKSLVFENKLSELGKFDSRHLEGVWYIPNNNTDSTVVLTNTSDDYLTVSATLTRKPQVSGSPHTFDLLPHETKVLNVREDFNQGNVFAKSEVLGLSLTHVGAKDALLAWTMVKDESKGYSNIATFSNPAKYESNQYHGAGLQIGSVGNDSLEPIVVLSNTTNSRVDVYVKVPYTKEDGTKDVVNLNRVKLKGGEVHKVNMRTVENLQNIKTAGIEIEYSGDLGSVIASVQSISQSKNQVFRTILWDPPSLTSAASIYPFTIEGTSTTKAYIKNAGFKDEKYYSHVTWENGGLYVFDIKTIKKGETVEIDVKTLRDEQIPDQKGRVIPPNISEGQIHWSLRSSERSIEENLANRVPLVGQMTQVDNTKGFSYAYFCLNCCGSGSSVVEIRPTNNNRTIVVGESIQFNAYELVTSCYGNSTEYNITYTAANWSSNNTNVATVDYGSITAVAPGEAEINVQMEEFIQEYDPGCEGGGGGPFFADKSCSSESELFRTIGFTKPESPTALGPGGCTCLRYTAQKNFKIFITVIVPPTVESLLASIPNTNQGTGTKTTQNSSLTYATGNEDDLMVFFKGTDNISIQAQNVQPQGIESQLRWQVERGDTVETGVPTLSNPPTGGSITLTPNKAGNFRLINYFDSNSNNDFDVGEELKVLRFAIVRIFVDENNCTITNNNQFTPIAIGSLIGVETTSVDRTCNVSLEGGGNTKEIGLNKVKMGIIANIYSESFQVTYETGNFTVNPVGALPQLYKEDTTPPTGGGSIFIKDNDESGLTRTIEFDNTEETPAFFKTHFYNGTDWLLSVGGPKYDEFISAYSESFPNHFVVVAKTRWEVFYNGSADNNLEWVRNGANVYLNGPNVGSANFDITVNNDQNSPQGGSVTSGSSVSTSSTQPLNVDTLYEATADYTPSQ